MPCSVADFLDLAAQLPEVHQRDAEKWSRFAVVDTPFAYLWPRTSTVGLRQTIAEQLALVAERPEAFEVQYTAGGFGWVVVTLAQIERDELAELTFEAWRLSAPAPIAEARGEVLPT